MSTAASRPRSVKGSSTTSETDKNNSSLYGDQSDQPFLAPAFGSGEQQGATKAATGAAEDTDMPSNLVNSHSNVPGMTPAELMAAHRRSLAAIPGNEDRQLDLHSLTLSRHQVEPEDVYRADMDGVPDDEYQECLNSFKFGQATDDTAEKKNSIHTNR